MNVTLQDINDNFPTFDKESYSVRVSEATDVNTTILTVKVNNKSISRTETLIRIIA